jgi:hypothetical protein
MYMQPLTLMNLSLMITRQYSGVPFGKVKTNTPLEVLMFKQIGNDKPTVVVYV